MAVLFLVLGSSVVSVRTLGGQPGIATASSGDARLPFQSLSHIHFQRFVFLLPEHPSAAMEVVAPLPCNEAVWPRLPLPPLAVPHEFLLAHVHKTSSRWTHCCLPKETDEHLREGFMIYGHGNGGISTSTRDNQSSDHDAIDTMNSLLLYSVESIRAYWEKISSTIVFLPTDPISIYDYPTMTVTSKDVCAFPRLKFIGLKGDFAGNPDIDKAEWSSITKQAKYISITKQAKYISNTKESLLGRGTFACAFTAAGSYKKSLSELLPMTIQSGSDLETEQHEQQQEGSPATIVDLRPSEVRSTDSTLNNDKHWASKWKTDTGGMNVVYSERPVLLNSSVPSTRVQGSCAAMLPAMLSSVFDNSHVTTQDSINTPMENTRAAAVTTWIVASAAPHHATGNRPLLSDFTPEHGDIFLFGGDAGAMPMQVVGHGVVVTETMVLPDVWYVPGLAANLVSVSQLTELDYSTAFGGGKCYIRSTMDGAVVGAAHAGEDGLFALDFLRVPLGL